MREKENERERGRGEVPVSREDLAIDRSLLVAAVTTWKDYKIDRRVNRDGNNNDRGNVITVSRFRNVSQLIKLAGIG